MCFNTEDVLLLSTHIISRITWWSDMKICVLLCTTRRGCGLFIMSAFQVSRLIVVGTVREGCLTWRQTHWERNWEEMNVPSGFNSIHFLYQEAQSKEAPTPRRRLKQSWERSKSSPSGPRSANIHQGSKDDIIEVTLDHQDAKKLWHQGGWLKQSRKHSKSSPSALIFTRWQ